MKWKIDYIKNHGIVQAITRGTSSREERIMLSKAVLEAGREMNVKEFLLDQRDSAFGLTPVQIKRLPVILSQTGFGTEDRMAILVNPESLRSVMFRFLREILALNSMRIQVFNDNAKAIAWLKTVN